MPQRRIGESVASRRRPFAAVVAMFVVALVAVVSGLIVGAPAASASTCAGPLADGEIRVVIVVDAGSIGGISTRCMVVPDGTTGAQLLARRAAELGTPAPRYQSLLCAIDGLPASGCGDRTAGGYAYWAYFAGASGAWVYGNGNPFIKRLHDGDIEGWRFVDGSGDGQDPPPRVGPGGLLPALAPSAPGGATSSGGSGASVDTLPPAEGPTTTVGADDPSVTTTSIADLDGSVDLAASEGAPASRSGGSSGAGSSIAVIVIAVLIAALAVGAWMRSRRAAP